MHPDMDDHDLVDDDVAHLDDQFESMRNDIDDLKEAKRLSDDERLQRKTLGYFRDVISGIMHYFTTKANCPIKELTVDKVQNFYLRAGKSRNIPSMSTPDWVKLFKLYNMGNGYSHPPPRTNYTTLRRFLEEHEKIQFELDVDTPLDMKPFLSNVIQWADFLKVPPVRPVSEVSPPRTEVVTLPPGDEVRPAACSQHVSASQPRPTCRHRPTCR